jgi:phosphoserine phosphatase
VFELSISPGQLSSSLFLQHLADVSGLEAFSFVDEGLLLSHAIDGASPSPTAKFIREVTHSTLLVFAEGLNLQKLSILERALSGELEVSYYQIVRSQDISGFAIAARVHKKNHQDQREKLEKLANAHSVELCLFDVVPNLAEPGLLLMDMDSTVIAVECIDEIAKLAGVGEQVSKVTEQAMQGKLDFAESLRSRVACLADSDESILAEVRDALPLMPGIFNLVRLLKQYHWKLAIASGGFTYFADYLAQRLELDAAVANQLDIVDGKLQGNVVGSIVDAQVKADTLGKLATKWSIPHKQTVAMGDGANDLVMMGAASLGVAFHAKPIVRTQADIAIRNSGLDALLWVLLAAK